MTPTARAFMPAIEAATPQVELERRLACRALLGNPLLPAAGNTAGDFKLVRRHFDWLKEWFSKFPAWNLHIDNEVARLQKFPADSSDNTRPALDRRSGAVFNRRRYALLCLVLAVLEEEGHQTTLAQVSQSIAELVTDPDLQASGLVFDIDNRDQRRDFAHAMQFLVDAGVLLQLDGDDRRFVERRDASDVLYDINRNILAAMSQASPTASAFKSRPGSREQRLAALEASRAAAIAIPAVAIPNDSGRRQQLRSRVVRALLDDPVLYFHDLDEDERGYLGKNRGYLLRQISEATGLVAEIRAEGIAMVDNGGGLSDSWKLPRESPDGQLGLLLAQWMAECFQSGAEVAIPLSRVREHTRGLVRIYGAEWPREMREAGAETRLTDDALRHLRALRLVRIGDDGVVPLAASCRYASGSEG